MKSMLCMFWETVCFVGFSLIRPEAGSVACDAVCTTTSECRRSNVQETASFGANHEGATPFPCAWNEEEEVKP